MRPGRSARRATLLCAALLLVALAPASAAAETYTFANVQTLFPAGEDNIVGPANHYPSTIALSGLTGTVTKATVTVLDLRSGNADDIDMALVGPNGEQVMLMSDACGDNGLNGRNWTFDDDAFMFLSNNGPCSSSAEGSFMPTNYLGGEPEPDDLSQLGGPEGEFLNSLSFFDGISPSGDWSLFVTDDTDGAIGFTLAGWALTLTVQPAPPPPPTVISVPAPAPVAAVKTGKRAAALAKCGAKKTKKARARCRGKARNLPL